MALAQQPVRLYRGGLVIMGVIQSSFIPWRGYFDFIDAVDLFVFHDDLQYTKNDWRNRNRIKTATGARWLTVPVRHRRHDQLICHTMIDYASNWIAKMRNRLRENYGKAPFFQPFFDEFSTILTAKHDTISRLNIAIIQWINPILGIATPLGYASDFSPRGSKTERLIDLLQKAGASAYLSGPRAGNYLVPEMFQEADIALYYKVYDYPEYSQLHGPFLDNLSILDLLFNHGPKARDYIKPLRADRIPAASFL
jgi:hypothetical protein